jgi:outer membrane protein assembly factor BamB
VECLAGEVAASPAYADGIVFVASEGATAAAIDIGTHAAEPKIRWQWREALPDAASPLAGNGVVIIPTSFGAVACLDAKTGKVCWEHEFAAGFNSSPVLANGNVHLVDLSGAMQVFKLDKAFRLRAANALGEKSYATPAFVGGRIYVRGINHLFCIEERR